MSTTTTPLQQQTIADTLAGWDQILSFAQFDPSLGTLTNVRIGLIADLNETLSFENEEAAPSPVVASISGIVPVLTPNYDRALTASPSTAVGGTLGAYDGLDDFSGGSGTVFGGLTNTTQEVDLGYAPSADELAMFTGNGSVGLTVDSRALLNETGPANYHLLSTASLGATVYLQYDYVTTGGGDSSQFGGSETTISIISIPLFPDDSLTTPDQAFSLPSEKTGWTSDIAVQQFDPSLGTLLGVNVTASTDFLGTISSTNLGPESDAVFATEGVTLSIPIPGAADTLTAAASGLVSGPLGSVAESNLSSNTFQDTIGGAQQSLYDQLSPFSGTLTSPQDLAAFIGTGTLSLPVTTTGHGTLDAPANVETEGQGFANANVTISYTYRPQCFAAGTRIATDRGERPVEDIRPGDRVRTESGALVPVIWTGHRRVDCARHREPAQIRPVRIAAHAFGPGQPRRDLLLSPDHAIFWECVLIPVRRLVNGLTIRQVAVDHVTYYHIETAAHQVVLAEGLPAETYLDTGDRASFANAGDAVALHPEFGRRSDHYWLVWESSGCAPLRIARPEIDRTRALLRSRTRQVMHKRPRAAPRRAGTGNRTA